MTAPAGIAGAPSGHLNRRQIVEIIAARLGRCESRAQVNIAPTSPEPMFFEPVVHKHTDINIPIVSAGGRIVSTAEAMDG